jgi:ABC-type transporter Mla subunit MlaD
MTIQDQAQQLAALAERLPAGHLHGMSNELTSIQNQVANILGATGSAGTIQSAIANSQSLLADLGASLEQIRQEIQNAAQHHMRG